MSVTRNDKKVTVIN